MGTKVQCRNCKDILESLHTHDFKTCSCFRAWERVFKDIPDNIKIDSKTGCPTEFYTILFSYNHGIFVDGGDSYLRSGGNHHDVQILGEEDDEVAPKRSRKRPTKTEAKRIKAVKDLRTKSRRS